MSRDWRAVVAIWVVLTALGEWLILGTSILPAGYAREAEVVDDAFVLLMSLGLPVLTAVVTMLAFSAYRFRTTDEPTQDGPPLKSNRRVVTGWLVVTGLLALLVLINPGFVGLAAIRGEQSADLQLHVQAQRFRWEITYPNGHIEEDQLVLPVDQRVRFDVDSKDVLHSFWIPAFRVKIDAVPGRTTFLYATPDRVGGFEDDQNLRVQCAELCGGGHANMAIPVRVLEQDEYQQWLEAELEEEGQP